MTTNILAVFFIALPAAAQWGDWNERRADVHSSGRSDSGKCTIEVEVDNVAEIEIGADRGRLHTLAGQPATWRRFECTGVMPRNPREFQFRGVDGRGRQSLARDPRGNTGIAMVRIEDVQGGREGYTFELEWSGGTDWGNRDNSRSPSDRGWTWPNASGSDRPNGGWNSGTSNNGGWNSNGSTAGISRAARACEPALRSEADRRYGLRDITLLNAAIEERRGNRELLRGEFEARGFSATRFEYSCEYNFRNGRIRNLEIRPR